MEYNPIFPQQKRTKNKEQRTKNKGGTPMRPETASAMALDSTSLIGTGTNTNTTADIGASINNGLLTPLEETQRELSEKGEFRRGALSGPSSTTPTGTLELSLTQAQIDSVAHLRDFHIDTLFKKLAALTEQLALVNPKPSLQLVDSSRLLSYVEQEDVISVEDLSDSEKESCYTPLQVMDGVQVSEETGLPLWERLPNEPQDFHNLFRFYRDQRYGYMTSGEILLLSRSMATLAIGLGVSAPLLSLLSKIFHWRNRVAAYDQFIERERRAHNNRLQRILQNDHLHYARQLTQRAFEKLSNTSALSTKDLLNMFELGIKYSRLSVGLSMDSPDESLNLPDVTGVGKSGQGTTVNVGIVDNSQANSQNLNLALGEQTSGREQGVSQGLAKTLKTPDTILSILNVLQRSGAVDPYKQFLSEHDPTDSGIIPLDNIDLEVSDA